MRGILGQFEYYSDFASFESLLLFCGRLWDFFFPTRLFCNPWTVSSCKKDPHLITITNTIQSSHQLSVPSQISPPHTNTSVITSTAERVFFKYFCHFPSQAISTSHQMITNTHTPANITPIIPKLSWHHQHSIITLLSPLPSPPPLPHTLSRH